ncbi:pilus assembly FimT family protein [Aureimonas sp. AU40]|uniref:pilus assembly FimT family protein n=1 Tax=Aureimonas sp. AU40 TaxID=1637747 RepID=UPI0007838B3F|nr:prepilin-type N-terminal cleavage/methylation domain-containing protein [Aureimonas sp. AU40]
MPTLRATERQITGARARDRKAGFALVELMLAFAVIALIAALVLPSARFGMGATLQRYEAQRIVSLLRGDRNAAIRTGRPVTTRIDLARGHLVAGGSDSEITLPSALAFSAQPASLGGLAFTTDGRSNGGLLFLGTRERGIAVRVDPLTASIQIERF